jgi:hypothetical protein
LPSELVVVHLRSAAHGFLNLPPAPRMQPDEFWPLPGQVPFPEGATADRLQDLIGDPATTALDNEAWVDLALAEGNDPEVVDVEDPWAAVLALEVARREANLNQYAAYQASIAAGDGPDNGYVTAKHLVGPPDKGMQRALAQDLLHRWPDHPAGDYARLYKLEAAVTGEAGNAQDSRDLALNMLRHTEDALVVAQSISMLTKLRSATPMDTRDIDLLRVFWDQEGPSVDELLVAGFALDQAMRRDDKQRTAAWLDRYRATLERTCTDPQSTPNCDIHKNNLNEVIAYVGDLDTRQATTWQQAFEVAGYQCARAGHDWKNLPARTRAVWNASWRWDPWDTGSSSFLSCFQAQAALGPEPPHPLIAVVSVVR